MIVISPKECFNKAIQKPNLKCYYEPNKTEQEDDTPDGILPRNKISSTLDKQHTCNDPHPNNNKQHDKKPTNILLYSLFYLVTSQACGLFVHFKQYVSSAQFTTYRSIASLFVNCATVASLY